VRPSTELPVHFFTIVLNGEPFIRYHLDVFKELPFRWHWHVIEGAASLVHDTAWSVAGGGRLEDASHASGLSTDGTTVYLDAVAAADPDRVSVYRKPAGSLWNGKREMVSAPLPSIREECLLWQVDADELWTADQISVVRRLFVEQPDRTAAYYWCQYFAAPEAVLATRYNYAANPDLEWLRTWRFQPGDRWIAHEPPRLVRPRRFGVIELAKKRPFRHEETEQAGAVFQHFAYATEEQVRFKESYYAHSGALEGWRRLRNAVEAADGPVRLGDFFPWVEDDTLVDDARRRHVSPLAEERQDGSWFFPKREAHARGGSTSGREGVIVVDGVFFQHFLDTGIARVWRSYLREWVKSGFARRVVFLDRAGVGPRIPGLPTRSVPLWRSGLSAVDSLRLQRICDEEGAELFVSTYYTTPIGTPSLMLVYDLIPERLGLDMSDPVWEEKRRAVEHASVYACISENTRRDLLVLEPGSKGKRADVVPLGVDDVFTPASGAEVAAFRGEHALERPYFLVVGERRGVDGYKNAELVFRAFRDWAGADDYEIVCIGGRAAIEPELRAVAPRARARRLSLGDEELRLAYAGAEALVFPSRYEGFGLPVAEAMACACPVITTPLASLPEVAGDAALYVDPDDAASLRQAFAAVRDPQRRAAMIAAGRLRADALTWGGAASTFASLLATAAQTETADQRRAREALWKPRRQEQADEEQLLRGRRRPEAEAQARPSQLQRLSARIETLALVYLPPRATARLRALKASTRRRPRRSGVTR
jgi:glycosyltransferase involved in cell wall biosynthesis